MNSNGENSNVEESFANLDTSDSSAHDQGTEYSLFLI